MTDREWSVGGRPLRECIEGLHDSEMPSGAELEAVAPWFPSPSPAMLAGAARWIRLLRALEAEGATRADVARVVVRGYRKELPSFPSGEVALAYLPALPADELRAIAEDAARVLEEPKPPRHVLLLGQVATLAFGGDDPAALPDALLAFFAHDVLGWGPVYRLLESLPPARRRPLVAWVLADPFNERNAMYRIRRGLLYLPLLDDDQRAQLVQRIDELGRPDREPKPFDVSDMRERYAAGGGPLPEETAGEDGITPHARRALDYWLQKLAKERLAHGIGRLAEERADWAVEVDAPELADWATWAAADDARREAIARAVEAAAAAQGLRFEGLTSFGEVEGRPAAPIAVFVHLASEQRLSLLPGGRYLRGFSPKEEHAMHEALHAERSASEARRGELRAMLEDARVMRPCQEVHVGPFLIFQLPTAPHDPADAAVMFEEMPFRLPSEAEHEYAHRGLKPSTLSWRGDEVPGEAWMQDAQQQRANAFGLCRFGLYPEVTADVFAPSYEGAPVDGSARRGEGPRAIRGGAAQYYPWQCCAEWMLLTCAHRTSAAAWEFFRSLRPALGVRLT